MKYKKIITLYSNDEIPEITIPAKYHSKVEVVDIDKSNAKATESIISHHNPGPKIIIYQKLEYKIGGIETWGYNLAKLFQHRDITFVFQDADSEQVERLSEFANVVIEKNGDSEYDCDIFISANYDGNADILKRVHAKKYYQTIHSDFAAMKKLPGWKNFELEIDPKYQVIAVSEQVQKGLQELGYDSVVARNPLAPLDEKRPLILLSMTRVSIEKGVKRIYKLAQMLKQEGISFIWLLASTIDNSDDKETVEKIKAMKEFKIILPSVDNDWLYYVADYCVQLSDTEAYCYTLREALQHYCPIIATNFPVAKEIIKHDENGYLVNKNLSNVDMQWFRYPLRRELLDRYSEPIDLNWEKILGGEL